MTDPLPALRAMLADVVRERGAVDAINRRTCRALLADRSGGTPGAAAAINLLLAAADLNVPQSILARPNVPRAILLKQLALGIEHGLFVQPAAARWAVEAWDQALAAVVGDGAAPTRPRRRGPAGALRRLFAGFDAFHDRALARVPLLRRFAPTAAQRAAAVAAPEVTVGVGCDFHTLADAVRAAPDGATIRVFGGTYRGPLLIDRPLRIVASETRGVPVLTAAAAPCVTFRAARATLRGFRIVVPADPAGRPPADDRPAVDIEGAGRPELIDCEVAAPGAAAAVRVRGAGADPLLSNVRIDAPGGDGIVIRDRAAGRVESCEVVDAGRAGISVATAADPVVRLTRVSGAARVGLIVSDGGLGVYELCDFRRNDAVNVAVTHGASAVLRRCRVTAAGAHNVLFDSQSTGTLDGCDVADGGGAGVSVRGGASPTLRGCRVRLNLGVGVDVGDLSACRVDDCAFDGNGDPLRVAASASAHVTGGDLDVPPHLRRGGPRGRAAAAGADDDDDHAPPALVPTLLALSAAAAALGACAGQVCSAAAAAVDRAAPISAAIFAAVPLLLALLRWRRAAARRAALTCAAAAGVLGAGVGLLLGLSGAGPAEGAILAASITAVVAISLEAGPLLRGLRPAAAAAPVVVPTR